jgi:hypothetical protein
MLCPTCRKAAPGGSLCADCGQPVPEQERFEGQGGHYMRVLLLLSLALFVGATVIASLRSGRPIGLENLMASHWFWLYMLAFFLPAGVGLYYWLMLRDEEIIVTDDYIARRSRWGDEQLSWDEVCAFHKQILPFRETRLGRIAALSRWLSNRRLLSRLPPYAYELIGCDAQGQVKTFRLEPGSVDDMGWLLAIIEAQVGRPREI